MHIQIKNNLKRFLPAEFISLILAYLFSISIYHFTENKIIAAYGGSIGDCLGYYGFLFYKEQPQHKNIFKAFKKMSFEFAPAEIFDALFIRPFCLYFFPNLGFGYSRGIILGKFCADILFYTQIFLSKKLFKKHI